LHRLLIDSFTITAVLHSSGKLRVVIIPFPIKWHCRTIKCVYDITIFLRNHYLSPHKCPGWTSVIMKVSIFILFYLLHHKFSMRINGFWNYLQLNQLPSWARLYCSWIYNYLSNLCLSPLKFEPRSWRGVLDTTLCNKVYQWLAAGFLQVLQFPPPLNWPPRYNWNIVKRGLKHHNPNPKILAEPGQIKHGKICESETIDNQ
jgi:hypothetical protein